MKEILHLACNLSKICSLVRNIYIENLHTYKNMYFSGNLYIAGKCLEWTLSECPMCVRYIEFSLYIIRLLTILTIFSGTWRLTGSSGDFLALLCDAPGSLGSSSKQSVLENARSRSLKQDRTPCFSHPLLPYLSMSSVLNTCKLPQISQILRDKHFIKMSKYSETSQYSRHAMNRR